MAFLITAGDVLLTKPKCTNVLAERGWVLEGTDYTDLGTVTVWYEYQFMDASDGFKVKTDKQWTKYELDFDTGNSSTVVAHALAVAENAIYAEGPDDPAALIPAAPALPTTPT